MCMLERQRSVSCESLRIVCNARKRLFARAFLELVRQGVHIHHISGRLTRHGACCLGVGCAPWQ